MAEKRMFTKRIIDSDAFLDMPSSAQALYFHLNMHADDDGFVNNPKKIQRMVGASEGDLRILIEKRYILAFESGIIVIKHWRLHNYLRKDTYRETLYLEEKAALYVKPDGAYTDHPVDGLLTSRAQASDAPLTQYSSDQDSKDQDSADNLGAKATRFLPPSLAEVRAYCSERGSTVNPQHFIDFYAARGWMLGKTRMKDWRAAVRTWETRSEQDAKPKKSSYQESAAEYRPPTGADDSALMRKLLGKQRDGD